MEDVEIFLKAGQMLLEFPDEFYTQVGVEHAFSVIEAGLKRAAAADVEEARRRRAHGFHSRIDDSVQPYTLTLPENYDPSKPVPLYVWLHGRSNDLTEAEFLYNYDSKGAARPPVADRSDSGGYLRTR